jgi:hypothetical protein
MPVAFLFCCSLSCLFLSLSHGAAATISKRADLGVLDANPSDNIHNVHAVRAVLADGVLYDPKPLLESVGFKPE